MELLHHLSRSKAQLLAKGVSEAEAEETAVKQMGNPIELGRQFNKLHRPKTDWMLISLFTLAFAMGLLPLLHIPALYSHLLSNRLIHIVLALIIAATTMMLDYRKLERYCWWFLGLGTGILVPVAYFPTATIQAHPYFAIYGIGYISSDAALPFLFLFWAAYSVNSHAKLRMMIPVYAITMLSFLLSSLPAAMIYSLVVLILLFKSSICWSISRILTVAGAGLSIAAAVLFWFTRIPYRTERLLAFLHPKADAHGNGFMYVKIRELIASGGWFGAGSSTYISNPAGELVLVDVAQSYGWVAMGMLIAVLILLLFRMAVLLRQTRTGFGRNLLAGILTFFAVQCAYNMGMIAGFLPLTSIDVPFVSYGFTSTLLNSFLFGLALSVCRRRHLVTAASK